VVQPAHDQPLCSRVMRDQLEPDRSTVPP
jgi:hypothetical protein